MRGVITSFTRAEGKGRGKVLAHVFIEGAKEPDTQVDKASVTVTAETKVFINRDGERKPAEFAALKEGQKVEAGFTGPVRLSYPVQADAAEITTRASAIARSIERVRPSSQAAKYAASPRLRRNS